MRLIFVLPGRGGGGGAHSVVQESCGMVRLGAQVAIATTADTSADFSATYPELADAGVEVRLYGDRLQLAAAIEGSDLAIATTAPSAAALETALSSMDDFRPRAGYYIQDYEPLFFTPGTPEWEVARASYTLLPERPLLFAKTDWLCSLVQLNHGVHVVKVAPSLDHSIYRPARRVISERVKIVSMVRPKTPRRAPRRTLRAMERVAALFGDQVQLTTFGCDQADLDRIGATGSEAVEHMGVLSRGQVASLLAETDLFLDLSDYQAFGRTGLEGMACGCVPVLPVFGGAVEYARHGENAYLVDTRSDDRIVNLVSEFVRAGVQVREQMRFAAMRTALDYSVERAALSEFEAFKAFLG